MIGSGEPHSLTAKNDYTFKTIDFEIAWGYWRQDDIESHNAHLEFYRWLNGVKAEAWDEGFLLATRNNPNKPHPMLRMNPYGTEES